MRITLLLLMTVTLLFIGNCISLKAAEWGDLSLRFVYDGLPPKAKAVTITRDQAVCAKHALVDESLLVNAENRGLANVAVYLYLKRGVEAPPVHASYVQTRNDDVVLDNIHCRFKPHFTLIRTSQTLVLTNSDSVSHNSKLDCLRNASINPVIPAKGKLEHRFFASERLPSQVSCSVHPWMVGWLLVTDTPYMAISDDDGNVNIENLPIGTHTFQVWHERIGYVKSVKINDRPATWNKGRVTIEIKSGENALGEVRLATDLFEE